MRSQQPKLDPKRVTQKNRVVGAGAHAPHPQADLVMMKRPELQPRPPVAELDRDADDEYLDSGGDAREGVLIPQHQRVRQLPIVERSRLVKSSHVNARAPLIGSRTTHVDRVVGHLKAKQWKISPAASHQHLATPPQNPYKIKAMPQPPNTHQNGFTKYG